MTHAWFLIPVFLIGIPLVFAGAWIGLTWLYGFRSSRETSDVAVILGAAVWGDEPSPVFRERIHHGITLYRDGVVPVLLMTGGLGKGKRRAESLIARDYAVRQGVPENAILFEDQSHTTLQNMIYAKKVMEAHQLRTALIVSDPIHMRRSMRMARDMGIAARPAPTPTTRYVSVRRQFGFLCRELYAHIAYLLNGG